MTSVPTAVAGAANPDLVSDVLAALLGPGEILSSFLGVV